MTRRRMTDDDVSRLPLAAARAELMEEIMGQDARRDEPVVRRPQPWAAALAGVAAVAVVVTATVVVPRVLADDRSTPEPASAGSGEPPQTLASEEPAVQDGLDVTPAPAGRREWVVLTTAGWTATYVSDSDWREVRYEKGRQSLDVSLAPAAGRDSYVEDRRLIDSPERDPGTQVRLLGGEALMWPYSARDHTAIGAVEGDFYPEVRGSGMDRAAYLDLLGDLVWVDTATFRSVLPDEFVDDGGREDEIARMLEGVTVPDEVLPITSSEVDRYQLGVDVVGAVVCGWLDRYVAARAAGDAEGVSEATYALAETRDWAILDEMEATGGYPDVVRDYVGRVQRGEEPEGYEGGLGCA